MHLFISVLLFELQGCSVFQLVSQQSRPLLSEEKQESPCCMFKFLCFVSSLALPQSSPSLSLLRCATGICPLLSKYIQHNLMTAITFAWLINYSLWSSSNIPSSSATHLQQFSLPSLLYWFSSIYYFTSLPSVLLYSYPTLLSPPSPYFEGHLNYFTINGRRILTQIHSPNF